MNPIAENPPSPPQVRGALPDAETPNRIYLLKNVSRLRATYEVRTLAMKAIVSGKKLVLQVPRTCRFDASLHDLFRHAPALLCREDLP